MKAISILLCAIGIINLSGQSRFDFGTQNDSALHYFNQGWHEIMDLGLWTQAETSFRKAVDADPYFAIGKSLVGRITSDLSERQQLSSELSAQMDQLDKDEQLLLGVFLGSMQAMNDRDLGIKSSPDDRIMRLTIAEENLNNFVQKYPDNAYIKAEYIEIMHHMHGPAKALEVLSALASPVEMELPFYMSYAAALEGELGNFTAAEDYILKLEQYPNSKSLPVLYKSYHDYHLAKGDAETAYKHITKAVDLDNKHLIAINDKKSLQKKLGILLDSETLKIQQLSVGTYIHTSYLETEEWGKVACNGMIVENNGEVVVVDTPVNDQVSSELLNWISSQLKSKVVAVVPSHFHVDCQGGLEAFHNANVISIAHTKTQNLSDKKSKMTFEKIHKIPIGEEEITLFYPGEGHTVDNIVGYYAKDSVLFGGCLIKSLGAGKGNLADANEDSWSESANKVKTKFSEVKHVVPGHGGAGDIRLLDFTIKLFADPIIIDENGNKIAPKNHPGKNAQSLYSVEANNNRKIDYDIFQYGNDYVSISIQEKGSKVFEFISSFSSQNIDLKEIEKRRQEWISLCNAHKANALVENLYSKDALYYNHKPLIKGHRSITSEYAYMNNPLYSLHLEAEKVLPVNKKMIFEIGQCSGSYQGKYILVWKKEADGMWRIFMDSNI